MTSETTAQDLALGERHDNGRMRLRLQRLVMSMFLALAVPAAAAAQPTVVTTTGTFTAVPSPSDARTNAFFGIRYAAPPAGALRWTPPQAPVPPAGTVVASSFGSACPQNQSTALPQSEDCLFLNVYVPASATPNARLPVYYFIHGGGFIKGTGADYDPSVLAAQQNVIVVTINYRLGALGWLVEPGLLATAANAFQNVGDAGDYGFMDQQFGLQWVQANIAGFGGDPKKVTVGGESGGGISVSALLASTNTAVGLFRGAIMESGWFSNEPAPVVLSQAAYGAAYGARFDTALGCTQPADAACLRGQPLGTILAAQQSVFTGHSIFPGVALVFGTRILPQDLSTAVSTGQFIRVPVLLGINANEGRRWEPVALPDPALASVVAAAGGPFNYDLSHPNSLCTNACSYTQEVHLALGYLGLGATANTATLDAAVAGDYPLAGFPDPYLANNAPSADEAVSQIVTDLFAACPVFDFEAQLSRWAPVFAYEFNDPSAPPSDGNYIVPPNDEYGFPTASEHGAELNFLIESGTPFNAGEQQLATEMKTYWGNFVTSGNPNLGSGPGFRAPWLPFNGDHAVQSLVPGPALPQPYFTFQAEHFCSTWEPFIVAE